MDCRVRPPSCRTGRAPVQEETRPFPVPGIEIEEDLREFCHVAWSLIMRVGLAALLVSHGMVAGNLPILIAGLLFLPDHHSLLAVSLGLVRRSSGTAGRGALVFLLSTCVIFTAGAAVAAVEGHTLQWNFQGSAATAAVIGAVVGAAAALGSADDVGQRELIGRAATAHL